MKRFALILIATIVLAIRQADATPGDIYIEVMGGEVSWVDKQFVGHAFLCLSYHLNNGVKEDCYGFYPAKSGTGQVLGPGVVSNEFKRDDSAARFTNIAASVKHKITEIERRAILKRLTAWNDETYSLMSSNCIDLVHAIAADAGLQRPNRALNPTPLGYVKALKKLNP